MFQSTMLSMMPDLMYGRHMFGSERPITFTSVRPDCFTASAAPGTAGVQMAMMSFTFGWALRTVCVSVKARSRSPSLGRIATSFISGYFAQPLLDVLFPLVLVRRGQRGGDDRELALAAHDARGVVHERVADPLRRRLVDEEVAGVRLGVGVPGDDLDAPSGAPSAARWRCPPCSPRSPRSRRRRA